MRNDNAWKAISSYSLVNLCIAWSRPAKDLDIEVEAFVAILQNLIKCLDKGVIPQVIFPDSNLIVKIPKEFRQNMANYLRKATKQLPKELLEENMNPLKREKGDKFVREDKFLNLLFRRNNRLVEADSDQLSNIPEERNELI